MAQSEQAGSLENTARNDGPSHELDYLWCGCSVEPGDDTDSGTGGERCLADDHGGINTYCPRCFTGLEQAGFIWAGWKREKPVHGIATSFWESYEAIRA